MEVGRLQEGGKGHSDGMARSMPWPQRLQGRGSELHFNVVDLHLVSVNGDAKICQHIIKIYKLWSNPVEILNPYSCHFSANHVINQNY